jgi:hypothetical protein
MVLCAADFIMKREYYIRKKCTEEGCNEEGIYSYKTQREYREALKKNKPYICNRHTRPNEVLSEGNLKTEVELKCVGKSYSTERCNFWQRAEHFGTDKLDSGFQYGNGYKAWAKDFPEGTILKVTAEIILPDA